MPRTNEPWPLQIAIFNCLLSRFPCCVGIGSSLETAEENKKSKKQRALHFSNVFFENCKKWLKPMETDTCPTWKFAKNNRDSDLRFGTWTIGFAQHVLGTSNPDPCWMCSPSGKCILRPRQAIFTNQRRHGQLTPKCVYFGHQERPSQHAILLRRQAPVQQQHKIDTLPGLIFKQSCFGRGMAMFGKCYIPATRVRFRVFGMWAPL